MLFGSQLKSAQPYFNLLHLKANFKKAYKLQNSLLFPTALQRWIMNTFAACDLPASYLLCFTVLQLRIISFVS